MMQSPEEELKPVISVVIPLYNKGPYVRRALDSVLGQSFELFECIVVDDGSTDGGQESVKLCTDSRVRLITQENAGVSAARNRGIQEARGKLVAFLDADDHWQPEFLAASVAMHEQWPEIVASFTNYSRSDTGRTAFPETPIEASRVENYFDFCLEHGGVGMWTSTVVAKRFCLLHAGGFPLGRKVGEDLDTWLRLAALGPVAYSPQPLAQYEAGQGVCVVEQINCDIWLSFETLCREGRLTSAQRASAGKYAALMRLRTIEAALCNRKISYARELLAGLPAQWRRSVYGYVCAFGCLCPWASPRAWGLFIRKLGFGPTW